MGEFGDHCMCVCGGQSNCLSECMTLPTCWELVLGHTLGQVGLAPRGNQIFQLLLRPSLSSTIYPSIPPPSFVSPADTTWRLLPHHVYYHIFLFLHPLHLLIILLGNCCLDHHPTPTSDQQHNTYLQDLQLYLQQISTLHLYSVPAKTSCPNTHLMPKLNCKVVHQHIFCWFPGCHLYLVVVILHECHLRQTST